MTHRENVMINWKGIEAGLYIEKGPNEKVRRYRFFRSNEDFHNSDYLFEARGIKQAEVFLSGYREAMKWAKECRSAFNAVSLMQEFKG
jgi:hypothetical protein